MSKRVPYYRQETHETCGPACLRMLFAMHGKKLSEKKISQSARTTVRTGTNRINLRDAAKKHGFKTSANRMATWKDVVKYVEQNIPVIVSYRETSENIGHYSIVTGTTKTHVTMHDPWHGENFRMPLKEFLKRWLGYHRRRKDRGWFMTIGPN